MTAGMAVTAVGGTDGGHLPVLLPAVLAGLCVRDGGRYVDGTFGRGGYSHAMLQQADCRVWAIDRDPAAIAAGAALRRRFGRRLTLIHGRFGQMDRLVRARGAERVDGVALDLGMSSPQLDDAGRGFSFRRDGPLDMRMAQAGPSAADLVAGASEAALADLIRRLGEDRHARRIARAIVAARADGPILRTGQLAEIVRRAVPAAARRQETDPATRTFQALRMAVNRELEELDDGLAAAERLLAPGGRLAVVSFHSLEDRPVKRFLRQRAGLAPRASRHLPVADGLRGRPPSFHLPATRPARPTAAEIAANPRARSARLRLAARTGAAPWSDPPSPAGGGAP